MNFKVNFLAAAIATSLLAGCGGSSSGSSSASSALNTDEQSPVEQDYTLTTLEMQAIGKGFVAGLDAQAGQLSTGLGSLAGSVFSPFVDVRERADGSIVQEQLKRGFFTSLDALSKLVNYGELLRLVAEDGIENYVTQNNRAESIGPSYAFDTLYTNGNTTFQFIENAQGQLTLAVNDLDVYGDNNSEKTTANYQFTYTKLPQATSKILVSGTVIDTQTGLNATITNLGFTAEALVTGSKAHIALEEIVVVLGDVTASARMTAELVLGDRLAEKGTLSALEGLVTGFRNSPSFVASIVSVITGIDADVRDANNNIRNGERLNLADLEISNVRIEKTSGEYLTAERIAFQDSDAANYMGTNSTDGYRTGVVATYAFNDAGDSLVLNNEFGSTTYTFIPASLEEPAAAKIRCVTNNSDNKINSAPRLQISCDEKGVDTLFESLLDMAEGRRVYGIANSSGGVMMEANLEDQGDVQGRIGASIDSILEPVTFSLEANGELGLAGGLTVPYQVNVRHPGAYNYQAEAVIGLAPAALTATFSTLKEDIVISSSIPYVPADSAYAPVQAMVKFTYNWVSPERDDETGIRTIGTLTVNDTVVGSLVDINNLQRGALQDSQLRYAFTYADGTYPAEGGLFTTLRDATIVDCEASEEPIDATQQIGFVLLEVCTADQSGVIELKNITDLFFAGLPITGPYYRDTRPEVNIPGPLLLPTIGL